MLNVDRQRELSKRISEVISDNRRLLLDAKLGSREWWRNVDILSQRRRCSCIKLDNQTLQDLNNYFGDLCFDTDYIEPNLMEIRENCEVPEISERQVWNILRELKKTATGPDQIPYWVWKDQAEIFAPIVIVVSRPDGSDSTSKHSD